MEEMVISLTINKWMLYIVVVALFASFISNMMALYTYYLKRRLANEKTKHENSGLHIADVNISEATVCKCHHVDVVFWGDTCKMCGGIIHPRGMHTEC